MTVIEMQNRRELQYRQKKMEKGKWARPFGALVNFGPLLRAVGSMISSTKIPVQGNKHCKEL